MQKDVPLPLTPPPSLLNSQQPPSPRRDSGKDDNLVTDPGRERKRLGCRWLTLLSALLGSGSRSLRPGCGVQHIGGPVPGHEARVVPVARALLEEALTEVRADAAARRHQPEVAAATATGPGSATGRRAWRGPPAARPRVPRTSPPPPPPRRRGAEPQPHAPEPGRVTSAKCEKLPEEQDKDDHMDRGSSNREGAVGEAESSTLRTLVNSHVRNIS
uniref:Tropomyosin-1, isoforms 33/34-like isoform X2 n=1 Tax=Castor canadensis TaxID=51338 RepID=A0A8B7UC35_CASCN|nr:tropomyosin-1, isoforms 33/34-like isoform X2 [Castor canadensis]